MAKVTFSSLENKMSFESSAAVSARIMAEAEKAANDSEKLAIMRRGFEEMAAAEKRKDDIFQLVLRCNLLGVTDGDISGFFAFVLRFYSMTTAKKIFTDFLGKLANETKRIKKDTAGNWVADLTASDDDGEKAEKAATTENATEAATADQSATTTEEK